MSTPTRKQPLDATLTALAAITTATDELIYATGADTFATTDLTSFARTLLDDANAAAMRATLGLVIGTDVLAYQPTQIQFGGSTSAYPELLRSAALLKVRLADDSAYANLEAGRLGLNVATSSQMLAITCDAAATKGLYIKGAASQSGNYIEVVTSAAAEVLKVASTGYVHIGAIGTTKAIVFSGTSTDARIESDGYTVDIRGRDSGQAVNIFTASGSSPAFAVSGTYTKRFGLLSASSAAWTTEGIASRTAAANNLTYTDTSSSGTVATVCLHSLAGQFLAASSATTYTDAATLYIDSIPLAGANVTITNRWAIFAAGGILSDTQLKCSATLASSSPTTGSGVFAGGVGIAGELHVGDVAVMGAQLRLKNYTVATLPSGTQGDTAFVTDALAPTFLTAVIGGGAIVTPVFYDGSDWVAF